MCSKNFKKIVSVSLILTVLFSINIAGTNIVLSATSAPKHSEETCEEVQNLSIKFLDFTQIDSTDNMLITYKGNQPSNYSSSDFYLYEVHSGQIITPFVAASSLIFDGNEHTYTLVDFNQNFTKNVPLKMAVRFASNNDNELCIRSDSQALNHWTYNAIVETSDTDNSETNNNEVVIPDQTNVNNETTLEETNIKNNNEVVIPVQTNENTKSGTINQNNVAPTSGQTKANNVNTSNETNINNNNEVVIPVQTNESTNTNSDIVNPLETEISNQNNVAPTSEQTNVNDVVTPNETNTNNENEDVLNSLVQPTIPESNNLLAYMSNESKNTVTPQNEKTVVPQTKSSPQKLAYTGYSESKMPQLLLGANGYIVTLGIILYLIKRK